ncbi:MAG: YlxR family protein [Chloroflexi bacterium]|nr:YlxR family protein [Chloroflexota bacterium]
MTPGKQPRQRKQPQRTCIGCRQVKPKRELVRIVRTPAGEVLLDPTGKAAGRGAYVCKRKACLLTALEHNRLEHALEISLTPEQRTLLASAAEAMGDE